MKTQLHTSLMSRLILVMVFCIAQTVFAQNEAQEPQMSPVNPPGFLARIDQDSPEEIRAALLRAEELYFSLSDPQEIPPLSFVLHGPEVRVFLRKNYQEYKDINDLAARLSAMGVINLQICQTRLKRLKENDAALFPFVGTVKLGAKEERRLIKKEKYQYF